MKKYPDNPVDEIPVLTAEQMIKVDRAMIEDYGITLIQMMENAGRSLAELARARFLGGKPQGKHVIVLAGRGGNGGGALVGARRLAAWGASVQVYLTYEAADFQGVPGKQLGILQQMQISTTPFARRVHDAIPTDADLVIDGVIGYGLTGAPRGQAAEMINWANAQVAPVLALDTPSGLDTTSGDVFEPVIVAAVTMTLALPKQGLLSRPEQVGELYLADISIPPELYKKTLGITVGPVFAESDIIRLD